VTGTQGGTSGQLATKGDERFGTGKIITSNVSGEALPENRGPIELHGGPPAEEDNQDLKRTNGCVRLHNQDINALISLVNTQAKNTDPFTNIFVGDTATLNSIADQRSDKGGYLYPELRNAGWGTNLLPGPNYVGPEVDDKEEHQEDSYEQDVVREHEEDLDL